MNAVLMFLLVLLLPSVSCAEWAVTSPTLYNGELAVLRWQGADPPDLTVGSFNGKLYFSEEKSLGPVILLGVDIETPVGQYPVKLVSVSRLIEVTLETVLLNVEVKDRGISRITLPPEMVEPKAAATLTRIRQEQEQLAAIFTQNSSPLVADLFRRPVPEVVNSPFGKKRVLNGLPRAPHSGTDFRSPAGRLIRTPARGTVVLNANLYYTGNTVILDHGAGLYSLFAHLSKSFCAVGQQLNPGQPLGTVGSTGRSTGAHLHWTTRLRETRIDPMTILSRFGTKTP